MFSNTYIINVLINLLLFFLFVCAFLGLNYHYYIRSGYLTKKGHGLIVKESTSKFVIISIITSQRLMA